MKRISILMVAMMIAGVSFAQINFSGTYTLTDREEVEGPQYGNGLSEKYVVTQTKDSLIVESYFGETKGRQAFGMDGTKRVINSQASKRRYTNSLKWSDDKKIVTLTTVFSRPDQPEVVDLTRIEVWSLSDDGKTLTVKKRSEETQSETWAMNGTFAKQ